jgi:hypothetical protein
MGEGYAAIRGGGWRTDYGGGGGGSLMNQSADSVTTQVYHSNM